MNVLNRQRKRETERNKKKVNTRATHDKTIYFREIVLWVCVSPTTTTRDLFAPLAQKIYGRRFSFILSSSFFFAPVTDKARGNQDRRKRRAIWQNFPRLGEKRKISNSFRLGLLFLEEYKNLKCVPPTQTKWKKVDLCCLWKKKEENQNDKSKKKSLKSKISSVFSSGTDFDTWS